MIAGVMLQHTLFSRYFLCLDVIFLHLWPNIQCYALQKRPVVALPVPQLEHFVRQKKETKPEKSQAISKHQTRMQINMQTIIYTCLPNKTAKEAWAELGQALQIKIQPNCRRINVGAKQILLVKKKMSDLINESPTPSNKCYKCQTLLLGTKDKKLETRHKGLYKLNTSDSSLICIL